MAFLITEDFPVFLATSPRHFSSLILWLLRVFISMSSMAKGKKLLAGMAAGKESSNLEYQ
jgi:hypothetical protein